jgi:hypothetical protein
MDGCLRWLMGGDVVLHVLFLGEASEFWLSASPASLFKELAMRIINDSSFDKMQGRDCDVR